MNNIFNKFTTHYKKSIIGAYGLSLAAKKKEIGLEELFWALLSEKGSLGQETLRQAGIKEQTRSNNELLPEQISWQQIMQSKETIPLSMGVKKAIIDSARIAAIYEHSYIGTEHLLYSLLASQDKKINIILNGYQLNREELLKRIKVVLSSTSKFSELSDMVSSVKERLDKKKQDGKRRDSILDFFGTDLTNETVQKNINPVIGRVDEINRVIQILSRRDKNNPILLGEPGVGKTAIVEGLAKKIMLGDVPDILLNKKIYALDMPLLVAGTSYRGEFEARIKQIVDEAKRNEDIILFIDELHNIMGAGSASGAMDAANILKPAMARGEIHCIGATTYDDFKKYIEQDKALARRMQKVMINEPSAQDSIKILKGIKQSYEKHHLLAISDEAVEAAVALSSRYLTDQFLPDKAIDLIDEAASKKRINRPKNKNTVKLSELEKELVKITKEKNMLTAQGEYNEALKFKAKEVEIVSKIYKLEEENAKNKLPMDAELADNEKITASDIREIISQMTKINIPDSQKATDIIKDLEKNLKNKIVGQDEAIAQLVSTLKRSTAGLAGERRPLGSFILAGPSGVGKTYSAKILAEIMSPDREGLIKLDMSEFGEKFNASKLIGAPAGYVGYEEGGLLTEKVKRNPYAVILLDEIEKAHADIFNLFLQIFEDGYLTDSKGRLVNFRNTIIIMTTNIGVSKASEKGMIGFGEKDSAENDFKEKLAEWMRPELLNRIDQILVFNMLTDGDLAKIIELELIDINNNLASRNLAIKWSKEVVDYLLKKCAGKDQGARIIRAVLREKIENQLADRILSKAPGGEINIKVKDDKIILA
ncbi:hypothetical protein A3B87_02575 [Candidatus Kuenenbacteria bacterium RIFCSPHIGHO2_02_FULL_39_13]|uniref:Clp R domain-containing protein n=1 Tax=Candidatus Kuenenbacteria bacterium RIFCSPHIGHO2_02_FULL_39_13 TaxID=1798561 RepID=A0A1F6FLG1_9BACT|nr:MAG: hypothetical protein A3B87_02575 [Candidatus Kuenenbacteria bacterium RIFCSPHIGHO2_02_FULL_39_13]